MIYIFYNVPVFITNKLRSHLLELIRTAHPVLAIVLLLGYGFLVVQFFKRRKQKLLPIDRFVTQLMRISLLLAYFTGLIMSMNMRIEVHKWHHYAGLAPVAVLFIFQFLPQILQKEVNFKGYSFMFLAMFISIVFISLTSGITLF